MEPAIGVFILFGVVALILRLIAGSFDHGRVADYLRSKGYKLVDCSWNPLGPGWFGEKDSRIYAIVYEDKDGALHKANVKTSMFSGVYLSHDQVVKAAAAPSPEAEEAALRRRLAELEAMKQNRPDRNEAIADALARVPTEKE